MIYTVSTVSNAEQSVELMMENNIFKQLRRTARDKGDNGWLSAHQFIKIWNHYDTDGNGYIENEEIDLFVQEFVEGLKKGANSVKLDKFEVKVIKEHFLNVFDENGDNRIDIREMAQILPMEEELLVLFRLTPPLESSVDFMRIWNRFDEDGSGSIDTDELGLFLQDVLVQADLKIELDAKKYVQTMLGLFDRNGDGKLQISEMSKLIPVKNNYLCTSKFKEADKLTITDMDEIFDLYDKDGDGSIEGDELHGFIKDLLEMAYEEYDASDFHTVQRSVLDIIDANNDGQVSRDELHLILLQLACSTSSQGGTF